MANQNTYFATPYDWQSGDDISASATGGDHASLDIDTYGRDLFWHTVGRDTGTGAGTATEGWEITFAANRSIAGLVLLGYNVSQDTADTPRIKLLIYSDVLTTVIGRTHEIPCRYRDDWGESFEPSTGAAEWSWFFGLDGASDATSSADDYYNSITPTFTGTPATVTMRSMWLRFWNTASPDGYWQSSMVVPLVDPLVVQPDTGKAGVKAIEVKEEVLLDVSDGVGRQITIEWRMLPRSEKEKIVTARARTGDGPIFVVPDDRNTHSSGGTINGDFLHTATNSPAGRGGLMRFVDDPTFESVAAKGSGGTYLYNGRATFETWGVRQ